MTFKLRDFSYSHRFILGSSSPWRQKVLANNGCVFTPVAPDIDEKAIRHSDPRILSKNIAHSKADACVERCPPKEPAVIICSDQVAVFRGEIREKPESEAEARSFICSYSGCNDPVETVTAIVAVNSASGSRVETVDVARVWFRKIPEEVVEQIIESKVIFTCCGGFCIDDGLMEKYVDGVEGTRESVLGAPFSVIEKLVMELLEKDGGVNAPVVKVLKRPPVG